jgi:hypothetical protein
VIELIRGARATGRPVYLASASNEQYVATVAAHLDLFDGWFASTSVENLFSSTKANRLVETFGERGFDYIGNDSKDIPVWAQTRRRVAVRPSRRVEKELLALDPASTILRRSGNVVRSWLKLLRVHQWSKNVLVFVPLVTAQHFDALSFLNASGAFLAFSLAASRPLRDQ